MLGEWEKDKAFKDAVHGYILVPSPIVNSVIDCTNFQRLKGIEQTGMKVLYPGASHDRFSHSLGVYWVGRAAFEGLQANIHSAHKAVYLMGRAPEKAEMLWERWRIMFWLACLLHDCGHAPFSHGLEFIYDDKNQSKTQNVKDFKHNNALANEFGDHFASDFFKGDKAVGQAHERMSAYFLIKGSEPPYKSKIKGLIESYLSWKLQLSVALTDELFTDCLEFMVRMIIGCHYDYEQSYFHPASNGNGAWRVELQIRNCVIRLLNSTLDADNLDYAIRNAAVSGYKTSGVDIARLTKAYSITTAVQCCNAPFKKDAELNHAVILKKLSSSTAVSLFLKGQCTLEATDVRRIAVAGKVQLVGEDAEVGAKFERGFFRTDKGFEGTVTGNIEITPPIVEGGGAKSASLYLQGKINGFFTGVVLGRYEEIIQLFESCFCVQDLVNSLVSNGSCSRFKLRIFPAYRKSSLSVLQSGIDACNFENQWIYAHHVTTYKNEFLYVHSLERYAEYLVSQEQKKLIALINSLNIRFEKRTRYRKRIADLSQLLNKIATVDSPGLKKLLPLLQRTKVSERLREGTLNNIADLVGICCQREDLSSVHAILVDLLRQVLSSYITDAENSLLKPLADYPIKQPPKNEVQVMHDLIAIYERKIVNGHHYLQSSDADLVASYKDAFFSIIERGEQKEYPEFTRVFNELQSRKYPKAMWKSYAEFCFYFVDWTDRGFSFFKEVVKSSRKLTEMKFAIFPDKRGSSYISKTDWKTAFGEFLLSRLVIVFQRIKVKSFPEETYVLLNSMTLRLRDIGACLPSDWTREGKEFFYFYYEREDGMPLTIPQVMQFVARMRKLVRDKTRSLEQEVVACE